MWRKLKENHPVVYEVLQWMILLIAVSALVINILRTI